MDNLEQLTTECTLGKASALENLKREAMAAAENLFHLKKTFRQYENQGLKIYGSSPLYNNPNLLKSIHNNNHMTSRC